MEVKELPPSYTIMDICQDVSVDGARKRGLTIDFSDMIVFNKTISLRLKGMTSERWDRQRNVIKN
jgi:hypothetical protein